MKTQANILSDANYAKYVDMVKRSIESRVIKEQEAQMKAKMDLEKHMDEVSKKTNQLVTQIRDDILTLRCPHCYAAFIDFEV